MARNVKKAKGDVGYTLFDVLYQDGAQSSNRKVPHADVLDIDDDAVVRAYLEERDREIAAMSGNPRGPIKSLTRSARR